MSDQEKQESINFNNGKFDDTIECEDIEEETLSINEENSALLTGKKLYICVFANCCCLFLVALDQTITMTILSTIATKFNSFSEITWITTAFVLPLGCMSQIWGKFSIIFGRKWCMLSSILIFEIGSIVCAVSNTMNSLIGGRVIQGIGGAGIMSCVFIIVSEITSNDKKPLLLSLNGVTFAFASVLGPIVGGLLAQASWRWCFWINLCFGGIVIPLFFFSFKSDWPGDKNWNSFKVKLLSVDYIGTILMVSSLVLILLGISFGTSYRWQSTSSIVSFIIGGILGISFIYWNLFISKKPVLPPPLLKIWKLNIAFMCLFFGNGLFLATLQFIAIYFQVIFDEDALHSGISMLSNVILTTLGSISVGLLMNRSNYVKPWMILSGFLISLGIGLFGILKVNTGKNIMIGIQIISGYGFGLMFHPPLVSAQLIAPKPETDPLFHEKGLIDSKTSVILATSYINFGRNIGGALISELSQLVYTTTLKKKLNSVAFKYEEQIPRNEILKLLNNIGYLKILKNQYGIKFEKDIKNAFLNSIKAVFWMTFSMSCIVLVCGCLMSNRKVRS